MKAFRAIPLFAGAVAALALCACGEPAPRAAQAKAGSSPQTARPSAAPRAGEDKSLAPEWAYSSVGKRDPFRSYLYEMDQTQTGLDSHCATPLGRYELVQLRLVAVVTGLEDPVAMLEAPSGVGYAVRRGACIGKNGGVVAAVRSGEVVVAEWAVRADGTRDRTQTSLRLPREASLNLEEQP